MDYPTGRAGPRPPGAPKAPRSLYRLSSFGNLIMCKFDCGKLHHTSANIVVMTCQWDCVTSNYITRTDTQETANSNKTFSLRSPQDGSVRVWDILASFLDHRQSLIWTDCTVNESEAGVLLLWRRQRNMWPDVDRTEPVGDSGPKANVQQHQHTIWIF